MIRRLLPLLCLALMLFAGPALAQSISIDLGGGAAAADGAAGDGAFTGRLLQFLALLTILSIAPSLLMMVTSFTRIVVVLSLLRSAIGIQQTPPNNVLLSLALFLTLFIMMPTMTRSWDEGIAPMMENRIEQVEGLKAAAKPFHDFMSSHTRTKDVALFMDLAKAEPVAKPEDVPYRVLIPAFMISELKRAFEIGFLLFLPFLIIDMVVSSILMSMGMMMLPPSTISLPFKVIFFVLVDGWYLIAGSLVRSYG